MLLPFVLGSDRCCTDKTSVGVPSTYTLNSINSGAIYGTKCMIEGMTKLIEQELGYKTNHILTGGNAIFVKDKIENYIYDPTLILEGLYQIYLKNR